MIFNELNVRLKQDTKMQFQSLKEKSMNMKSRIVNFFFNWGNVKRIAKDSKKRTKKHRMKTISFYWADLENEMD